MYSAHKLNEIVEYYNQIEENNLSKEEYIEYNKQKNIQKNKDILMFKKKEDILNSKQFLIGLFFDSSIRNRFFPIWTAWLFLGFSAISGMIILALFNNIGFKIENSQRNIMLLGIIFPFIGYLIFLDINYYKKKKKNNFNDN